MRFEKMQEFKKYIKQKNKSINESNKKILKVREYQINKINELEKQFDKLIKDLENKRPHKRLGRFETKETRQLEADIKQLETDRFYIIKQRRKEIIDIDIYDIQPTMELYFDWYYTNCF